MAEIVATEGTLGGEPRLDGRRITVLQIADLAVEGEHSTEYVADQLDISLAEVHTALAYYYDHPEEMEEIRARHRALEERLKEESGAPSRVEQ